MWGCWTGLGRALDEAFGVDEIGSVKNGLAFFDDELCLTMVERRRSKEADPRMMMLFVVPAEEVHDKGARIFNGTKAIWKTRPVLQGPELAFRVRVEPE